MISNSFHSSAKSHSISSVGSLAKAERHNSRGYFSFYYDKNKISDLIGTADSLAADVENAINQTFAENVSAYNEKQKRADRKIQTSAFEHFAENKKLDLAVESILQIGDKEFWGQFRNDQIVHRNGRELVLKSFPGEVKRVMDDIFQKQIAAYENIYQTHGDIIAAKICTAYDEAAAVAAQSEQEHPDFKEIYKTTSKERVNKIKELSPEDRVAFAKYAEARDTMAVIVNSKLRERISANHMHIKVVSATAHYDEFSPHAHSISLCYADGYSKGLSSRVAKSVVLNRWALEVIQDRMHEMAEQEMKRHPEIFHGEDLKTKEQGRNFDYTTEQMQRQKLARLKVITEDARRKAEEISLELEKTKAELAAAAQKNQRLQALNASNLKIIEKNDEIIAKNDEIIAEQQQIFEENEEILTEQANLIGMYQSHEEYLEGGQKAHKAMDDIQEDLDELPKQAKLFHAKEAESWRQRTIRRLHDMMEFVKYTIGKLQIFEKQYPEEATEQLSVPAQKRASALDNVIASAERQRSFADDDSDFRRKRKDGYDGQSSDDR